MSSYPKENISYKYFFTPDEKNENAQSLAQAQVGRVELEDEKKAVMSEYKAKIDSATSMVNLLSRHVIDGYTTKTMVAAKRKNFTTMRWEWFDEESGEVLKSEPLTGKDKQQDIPFMETYEAVVTPEAEDLDNGHEAVANPDGSGYFRELPNAEARQLPSGENSDGDGGGDDNDDDTTFDADTYNPGPPKPSPPTPPKNKGGRPRKIK